MQAEFNTNLVKNLPDAYKKSTKSNNEKLLAVDSASLAVIREDLQEVDSVLDINNAKGKTLDLYGERVGQARGLATDDKYILMIKSKIMRNLSSGSLPSVIDALCATFGCDPSQICISDGEEPYTVNITELPISVINKAGLTVSQTLQIIKSLLPIGVTITSYLFEGTFEFSASENEIDNEKGFANEAETVGGYFGATNGDTENIVLPI